MISMNRSLFPHAEQCRRSTVSISWLEYALVTAPASGKMASRLYRVARWRRGRIGSGQRVDASLRYVLCQFDLRVLADGLEQASESVRSSPGGNAGHRAGVHAHARDALLPTLHERCARATERVQDPVLGPKPETLEVVTDEVRREGQDKTVPFVNRSV